MMVFDNDFVKPESLLIFTTDADHDFDSTTLKHFIATVNQTFFSLFLVLHVCYTFYFGLVMVQIQVHATTFWKIVTHSTVWTKYQKLT